MDIAISEASFNYRQNHAAPSCHGDDPHDSENIAMGLLKSRGLGGWEHILLGRCFDGTSRKIGQHYFKSMSTQSQGREEISH